MLWVNENMLVTGFFSPNVFESFRDKSSVGKIHFAILNLYHTIPTFNDPE